MDITMLGEYVRDRVRKYESNSGGERKIYLHFKMKNRKQTKEEVKECVNDSIKKATKKSMFLRSFVLSSKNEEIEREDINNEQS